LEPFGTNYRFTNVSEGQDYFLLDVMGFYGISLKEVFFLILNLPVYHMQRIRPVGRRRKERKKKKKQKEKQSPDHQKIIFLWILLFVASF